MGTQLSQAKHRKGLFTLEVQEKQVRSRSVSRGQAGQI